jgi:hypothetical protein
MDNISRIVQVLGVLIQIPVDLLETTSTSDVDEHCGKKIDPSLRTSQRQTPEGTDPPCCREAMSQVSEPINLEPRSLACILCDNFDDNRSLQFDGVVTNLGHVAVSKANDVVRNLQDV